MAEHLSLTEVAKRLRIPESRVKHLCDKGVLKPVSTEPLLFDSADVQRVEEGAQVLNEGVSTGESGTVVSADHDVDEEIQLHAPGGPVLGDDLEGAESDMPTALKKDQGEDQGEEVDIHVAPGTTEGILDDDAKLVGGGSGTSETAVTSPGEEDAIPLGEEVDEAMSAAQTQIGRQQTEPEDATIDLLSDSDINLRDLAEEAEAVDDETLSPHAIGNEAQDREMSINFDDMPLAAAGSSLQDESDSISMDSQDLNVNLEEEQPTEEPPVAAGEDEQGAGDDMTIDLESTDTSSPAEAATVDLEDIDVGGSSLQVDTSGDETFDLPADSEIQLGNEIDTLGLDPGATDVSKGSSAFDLGDSGTSDLTLSDSSIEVSSGTSDIMLDQQPSSLGVGGASAVNLEEDDDEEEFVLGGSEGSDITLRPSESGIGIGAGESGIALAGLADSGISLESPVELGGSSIGSSIGSSVGASGREDSAFMLEPAADDDADDSSDSGSQVIALDAEGEFDEEAATMLGPEPSGGRVAASEPAMTGYPASMPGVSAPQMASGPQMAPAMAMPQEQYVPFTFWNVFGLFFCMVFLVICGLLAMDMMRFILSWETGIEHNGILIDTLLENLEGLWE